jgi:hypothetical protein
MVAAGHGLPVSGPGTAAGVQHLAKALDPPAHGRYIQAPAQADLSGVRSVPPPVSDPVLPRLAMVAAGLALAAAVWSRHARAYRSRGVRAQR